MLRPEQSSCEIARLIEVSRDQIYGLKKDYGNSEGYKESKEMFVVNIKPRKAPRPIRNDEFVATEISKV